MVCIIMLVFNRRFLPDILFLLPTNFTNLHEFITLHYNGDLYGRTNFTNSIYSIILFDIFGCARQFK